MTEAPGRYRMTSKLGTEGINLDLLAHWKLIEDPDHKGNIYLFLYFSGLRDPLKFRGEEAKPIAELLCLTFKDVRVKQG